MNLLQELQARTEAAQKSTPEEVKSVFDAIVNQCLVVADMGRNSVYVDSTDIDTAVRDFDAQGCRESSFDDAFTRALAAVVEEGVVVRTTREEHLFMLLWEA